MTTRQVLQRIAELYFRAADDANQAPTDENLGAVEQLYAAYVAAYNTAQTQRAY